MIHRALDPAGPLFHLSGRGQRMGSLGLPSRVKYDERRWQSQRLFTKNAKLKSVRLWSYSEVEVD